MKHKIKAVSLWVEKSQIGGQKCLEAEKFTTEERGKNVKRVLKVKHHNFLTLPLLFIGARRDFFYRNNIKQIVMHFYKLIRKNLLSKNRIITPSLPTSSSSSIIMFMSQKWKYNNFRHVKKNCIEIHFSSIFPWDT